jgi:hypothetical protein
MSITSGENSLLSTIRETLEFYRDPWSARDPGGDHDCVPDFYAELCFGERAESALDSLRLVDNLVEELRNDNERLRADNERLRAESMRLGNLMLRRPRLYQQKTS